MARWGEVTYASQYDIDNYHTLQIQVQLLTLNLSDLVGFCRILESPLHPRRIHFELLNWWMATRVPFCARRGTSRWWRQEGHHFTAIFFAKGTLLLLEFSLKQLVHFAKWLRGLLKSSKLAFGTRVQIFCRHVSHGGIDNIIQEMQRSPSSSFGCSDECLFWFRSFGRVLVPAVCTYVWAHNCHLALFHHALQTYGDGVEIRHDALLWPPLWFPICQSIHTDGSEVNGYMGLGTDPGWKVNK